MCPLCEKPVLHDFKLEKFVKRLFKFFFAHADNRGMAAYPLTSIVENSVFSKDVTLGKNFLLLCANMTFSPALKKALADWDFREVQSEGVIGVKKAAKPAKKEEEPPKVVADTDFKEVSIDDLEEVAEEEPQDHPKFCAALKSCIQKIKATESQNNDSSRMDRVRRIYNEYTRYILNIYTYYATHRRIIFSDISEATRELAIFIKENQRFVLRITPKLPDNDKNFLITHSMRSTVLAIAIGLQLRMPMEKLVELGVAAILHEIGQIRLPPQLYMNEKVLQPAEKAQMQTHPILSFNILKENSFPLTISLAALEHHERENGAGYPRHLTGRKISIYAKIIGVACSFEAISNPRTYKEEKTTFAAMVEMLHNYEHKYDETVIKALLYSLSLYPIGAYVYLSNGKVGQVTDVNPEQPMHPIVQVMNEKDDGGNPITIQSDNEQNKIIRVLNKEEAENLFITSQLDS